MATDKFKNKYRISSARLQNWDYGSHAAYFVTICTKDRAHFFGEIVASQSNETPYEMQFSEIGKIVDDEWLKTFEIRPDMNLLMGAYTVMPNHIHAIITIGENEYNTLADVQHVDADTKNKFGPQSKNLASIMRGFKSGVTQNARKINPDFAWQPRFHDHIIRNYSSFLAISNYINTNVLNWKKDKFYNY